LTLLFQQSPDTSPAPGSYGMNTGEKRFS